METSATAAIKRHNSFAPWSPRPVPKPSPLHEIVASHWGVAAASDFMQHIVASRSFPRKVAQPRTVWISQPSNLNRSNTNAVSEDSIELAPLARNAPPVPRRHASLQGALTEGLPDQEEECPDRQSGFATKIWTEMRCTSTSRRSSRQVKKAPRLPSDTCVSTAPRLSNMNRRDISPLPKNFLEMPTTPEGGKKARYRDRDQQRVEAPRHRETTQTHALWNQRPIGADSLQRLATTVMEKRLDGRQASRGAQQSDKGVGVGLGTWSGRGDGSVNTSTQRGKKDTGHWVWNGWW
ncbi:hypothetical protein GQ53DRAFT_755789 [Thozetella sp. PMI_491]|nr:hypothetical protein GQ53DRAFT_755789 [Thozetella sp. PMI_491]